MSEESKPKQNFDNQTLTLVTTALVAACNLISNDILKKVCMASSPCCTLGLAYVFLKSKNIIYHFVENKRSENTFRGIIADLN